SRSDDSGRVWHAICLYGGRVPPCPLRRKGRLAGPTSQVAVQRWRTCNGNRFGSNQISLEALSMDKKTLLAAASALALGLAVSGAAWADDITQDNNGDANAGADSDGSNVGDNNALDSSDSS